jgi:hypothetical protein
MDERGPKKVIAVADKIPTQPGAENTTAHRARPRTPEQQALIDQHAELVREMYAGRDARLVAALLDETPLWTDDLVRMFGITDQRTYILYGEGRDLFEAGFLIHPAGIPIPDVSGGMRGRHEIRGISFGRLLLWALGAHRAIWNPDSGEPVWVEPNSSQPQVDRARAALASGRVPERYHTVLQARIDNPDMTTAEIARTMELTKAQYTSALRRALEAAERQ